MSRDKDNVTVVRYEACSDCKDGSCGSCGQASSDSCAPGVKLVVRRVRFVRCTSPRGVGCCGPTVHPQASPGITTEVIEERSAERWVPSVHWNKNGVAACGTPAPENRLTDIPAQITCTKRKCKGVR